MEIRSRSDKLFEAGIIVILSIICILVIYPLIFVASASVSNPLKVISGEMWLLPVEFNLGGYAKVFGNPDIMRGYGNTILYTVVGTAINLILTICAAFPLSRKDFFGRNVITGMMVFTMFFSGGLIPTFLLVKNLGMVNTMWALILPAAVGVYNIIIMRTFFQSNIPYELQEAASIDGYSHFRILLNIILPLSAPIIVVMILFYSVGHWNSYFAALIYLKDRTAYPLQLILREILIVSSTQSMTSDDTFAAQLMEAEKIKYAVIIVANLPILMLYPFVQKYFVQGITIGALKG
ncbi:carbohydrate ABC transporter permease [Paenibacillus sp. J5C_2022]|uniref:carbohydrate ABC transporter permease n=1 Tax=Paenibacillus sp. J5C2022 TaxID=2977129 RepID=UPI0021D1F13D|nr:carbohydrate ABC transporter permease [Paenibacillus sp. J5C2022]MCU6708381.1 carbohydrate ABC transporter permease [Paenibacillus sp. J5C2022]